MGITIADAESHSTPSTTYFKRIPASSVPCFTKSNVTDCILNVMPFFIFSLNSIMFVALQPGFEVEVLQYVAMVTPGLTVAYVFVPAVRSEPTFRRDSCSAPAMLSEAAASCSFPTAHENVPCTFW